jgi:polyhydroxyalkanoate synthesis regulator phasin
MHKPKSKEHIDKIALTKVGNHNMLNKKLSKESKELMRQAKLGKKQSLEHIKHKIESRKNKKQRSPFKILCPYCNTLIDSRNYKRWHGENCKFKLQ